jgi:hypothetical protein
MGDMFPDTAHDGLGRVRKVARAVHEQSLHRTKPQISLDNLAN